jgi:hypothetical protein
VHIEVAERIAESIPERETTWSPTEDELHAAPPSQAERTAAEMETGFDVGDESVARDEGDERGQGRPRRRRRGRGGRGQSDERKQSGRRGPRSTERIESAGGPDDDFDDLGVEQAELEGERTDSNGIDFDAGDDLGDIGDADSEDRGSDSRGHRSIPSWDEAIGMIVESNLQSRSQRPRSSHTGRRGGGSRGGRPRGGRRHNNPQNGQ